MRAWQTAEGVNERLGTKHWRSIDELPPKRPHCLPCWHWPDAAWPPPGDALVWNFAQRFGAIFGATACRRCSSPPTFGTRSICRRCGRARCALHLTCIMARWHACAVQPVPSPPMNNPAAACCRRCRLLYAVFPPPLLPTRAGLHACTATLAAPADRHAAPYQCAAAGS